MSDLPDESHRLTFPKLPGMHAWIVVDDEPLKMYATDEMRKKGEAFVEAVTDATFEIYLADARGKRPTFSWDVEIYTDGAGDSSCEIIMEKSDSIYDEPVEEVVWVREGLYDLTDSTLRRFRFAELQLAEAADDALAPRDVKEIGCVELRYLRITHVVRVAPTAVEVADEQTVLEEDCKAELSHRIGFGEKEPSDQADDMGSLTFRDKDPFDKPYSCLKIFYRSKAFLEAQALIPVTDDDSGSDLEIITPPPRKRRCGTDPASPSPASTATAAAALAVKKARLAKLEEETARARAEIVELEDGGAVEQVKEEGGPEARRERDRAPLAPLKLEEEIRRLGRAGAA
ncbi:hypothetical protein JCM8208_007318 [Rhodotorula glutinis]